MLEPAIPSPHICLLMLYVEVLKAVGAKEITLLGATHSSAARSAGAGGLDYTKGDDARTEKLVET
jgi:hypothetical protein